MTTWARSAGSALARRGVAIVFVGLAGSGAAAQASDFDSTSRGADDSNLIDLLRVELPISGVWSTPEPEFGGDVAVGDIDGDGFAEMAVGAPGMYYPISKQNNLLAAGMVFLFRGRDRGIWKLMSPPEPMTYGFFGSGLLIRDFNEDGFGDLVVVGDRPDSNPATWVYLGPDLERVVVLEESLQGGANTNAHALAAGDVDGDGHMDLVIGDPFVTGPTGDICAVFVHYGPDLKRASYFQRPDQWTSFFGEDNAVGDVNGDGIDDILTADPYADANGGFPQQRGRAWLFYGPDFKTKKEFSNPDDLPLIRFAQAPAIADLNGDGFAEVILGTPGANGNLGQLGEGAAFLYWGPSLKKKDMWRLTNRPADQYGGSFGSSVDRVDIDQDGFDDLLIGAIDKQTLDQNGHPRTGELNILHGPDLSRWTKIYPPADPNYVGLGGLNSVGDVTGDRAPDILMGCPLADNILGRAYLADLSSLRPFTPYQANGVMAAAPPDRLRAEGKPESGGIVSLRVPSVPDQARGLLLVGLDPDAIPFQGGQNQLSLEQGGHEHFILVHTPWFVFPLGKVSDGEDALDSQTKTLGCDFDVPRNPELFGMRLRMQAFT